MLAYVFWHRPATGVSGAEYEQALLGFHRSLEVPSAAFRVAELPFADGGRGGGYEDWYLVEDWDALGRLNALAVDADHRPAHDAASSRSADGWGALYALLHGGPAEPPLGGLRWVSKRPVEADTVWQRQMVLGPAPEFCVVERSAGSARVRL